MPFRNKQTEMKGIKNKKSNINKNDMKGVPETCRNKRNIFQFFKFILQDFPFLFRGKKLLLLK